jgi:hypothetical protein|tara:strand:- start:240 stop:947 length:708 start_codon:yes stop_codon:yes gene_type:complete
MANKNKPDMKIVKDGSVESKLTKNYENQVGKTGSKEEQAALAKELVNDSPRKMSEIIKDKREALKKNEDLLRDLQTNEYDIPMSSPKLYKQLMKFLEKDAEWGHTTATGLVMLYSNLKENSKIVQSKDWDGIVKLRGTSITILWTMVTSMKGKGFFEARNFIELMAAFGQDLSTVVQKVHVDNSALRENHAKLSELDTEVNHPDVILDVAIDKYNEAEEELTDLMNEVDPVVETV